MLIIKKIKKALGIPTFCPVDWSKEDKYIENIKQSFYNDYGRNLDLDNPKKFSEKMQWLRVYDNTQLKTDLSDKYKVRKYVADKIGEDYLVPLIGVYDNFDEIDIEALPEQFVMQCNHGCGYNIIVKDKSQFDIKDAKSKINKWMKEEFAYEFGEWHYKGIERKIVITKYLAELSGDISDYKFFCFNGEPKYMLYITDRKSGTIKNSFFDMEFNDLHFNYTGDQLVEPVAKPENYEKMIELARILGESFKQVRVDFYNINGKIYFGELTFTSYGGHFKFNPPEWDEKLGELLDLGI